MSVVQSADGEIADLEALRASGKPVLLDVSQAAGWMPLSLAWADFVVGVGYKADVQGKKIVFSLGYSHPIEYALPEGIDADGAQATLRNGVLEIHIPLHRREPRRVPVQHVSS